MTTINVRAESRSTIGMNYAFKTALTNADRADAMWRQVEIHRSGFAPLGMSSKTVDCEPNT